jgi:hypothetical protein
MHSHHLLDLFNWIWIIVLILVIFGIISKPNLYDEISFVVKIIISIVLIYKFNDFRSLHTFTELDKRFCFMAGTNLFMLTCGDYINNYIGNVKNVLKIDL